MRFGATLYCTVNISDGFIFGHFLVRNFFAAINFFYLLPTKDTWLTAWACVLEVDLRMLDDSGDDMCRTALTDADFQLFYKSHT